MITSLLLLMAGASPAVPQISAERIKADVRMLSSEAFGGRGPGEAGEDRTVAYLAKQFAAAGLEPGGENGGWFQSVPLVRLDRQPGAAVRLNVGGRAVPLRLGGDATLALRNAGATALADAPIVFAGFGIVDAARGWDSYKGVDMRGKVALVLANDPDFEAGSDLGFEGRRLTYGGRVGVKFEAAAKAGAAGVIVLHEDAAASYPFNQLASGDALPTFAYPPLKPSALQFSGWVTGDVGVGLLTAAGLTLDRAKAMARNPAFRAVPIPRASISASGSLTARPFTSRNVIGRLKGTSRPDEYLVYGAHWDANGRNGPVNGDGIRNGAIDNALGTSELIEVARAFRRGKAPARSVVFAAWTSEEKGLLGSEYFAGHPLYPLAQTVAAINLDPHVALPAARNIELIGGGRTSLEKDFARVASTRALRVTDEPNPEAGWYFRSDHFSFARRGVPALAFRAGRDLIVGGAAAGQAIVATYNSRCYHQPCDEFRAIRSFAGPAQEATVAYRLGAELASSTGWPTWRAGSEYAPLWEALAAQRR